MLKESMQAKTVASSTVAMAHHLQDVLKMPEVWYLSHCTWGTKACKSTYMLNDFSTLTQRHFWRDWVEEEEQWMGI